MEAKEKILSSENLEKKKINYRKEKCGQKGKRKDRRVRRLNEAECREIH